MVSFAAYGNTFTGEFIWDDRELILDNYYIKDWGNLFANITSDFFFTSREEGKIGYYRPVITLSYMINYSLFKINPWGYHLTNIIFHLVNGILVYLLAVQLLGSLRVSLLASLLFAVHPVHTESVSWIAGRTDVIACTFFLISFYLYLQFTKKKTLLFYALSLSSFTLSLFSKEMAITLPLILILYDYYYTTEGMREKLIERIKYWVPFFVIISVFLFIKYALLNISMGNPYVASFGKFFTMVTFGKAFIYYLKKLLWPFQLNAYVVLPFITDIASPSALLALSIFALSLYLLLKYGHQLKGSSFSLAFFWITLIPISNLIPVSAPPDMGFPTCERFLYIPSIGFSMIGALALEGLIKRFTLSVYHKAFLCLLLVSLLSAHLTATLIRNEDWQEELHFYAKTSKSSPLAYIIHNNLGSAYIDNKMYAEAKSKFQYILRLKPGFHYAHLNLGVVYYHEGMYDEAIKEYQNALRSNPDFAKPHSNLATIYIERELYDQAWEESMEALKYNPTLGEVHNNLGTLYEIEGDLPKAIEEYHKALKMKPYLAKAHYNLGNVYTTQGLYDQAVNEFKEALRLDPDHADTHNNLGICYKKRGLYDQAIEAYQKAIATNPDDAKAYSNLGNIFWEKGQYEKAIPKYQKALELNPDSYETRNSLGIAYQSRGWYEQAIKAFKEALKLKPDYALPHVSLGTIYKNKGLYDKAIEEYSSAIKLNPSYASAYNNLGAVYKSKGLPDQAIEAYKKALAIDPALTVAYYNLGVVYEGKRLIPQAIKSYQTFIEKMPRDAIGYYRLATLYEQEGKLSQAITMYNKSLTIKPDSSVLHFNLAKLYLKKGGEGKNALTHLKKTIELEPNHSQAKSILNKIKELEGIVGRVNQLDFL